MKKVVSIFAGMAMAGIMSAFAVYADDVELAPKHALIQENNAVYTVESSELAASRFTEDTEITVVCDGVAGDVSPVKLVLDYWDYNEITEFEAGSPAWVEVEASSYKDGSAVFTYADIVKALGKNELSTVYAIDVASETTDIVCSGFNATNVISAEDAEENDLRTTVRIHARRPRQTSGWGQSMTITVDQFDISNMAMDSKIIAQYDCDMEKDNPNSPVEFILQSTDDQISPKAKSGTVWAKVPPIIFTDKYAEFDYLDMADSYGTEDFSYVTILHVGDTDKTPITCTDVYALNVKMQVPVVPEEPEDSSVAEEAEEITASEDSVKPVESKAPAADTKDSSSADEENTGKKNIVLIVVGIVGGIIVAGLAIFLILGRKSRETYDVNKHRFVKK